MDSHGHIWKAVRKAPFMLTSKGLLANMVWSVCDCGRSETRVEPTEFGIEEFNAGRWLV